MADGIFATNEEVSRKAGANASSTSNVEAYILQFMTEAESLINATTLFNWSDAFSGLNVDVKGILKLAASSWAAIQVIRFDMSGFTSRQEALTMINSLLFDYKTAMIELKKVDVQDFMNGVS